MHVSHVAIATKKFAFCVGNVEPNCEQFEKFENEVNSDKRDQMTTLKSHSKVMKLSN